MALLKKIALLVVVLGVYVAYESNKVYVSEGFENPNGYKLVVLGARALQKLAKLSRFVYGDSIGNLKVWLNKLESPGDSPLDYEGVDVEYKQLGGVYCRIYRPIGSAKSAVLPAVIYYHGGGYVLGSVTGYDSLVAEWVKNLNLVVFSVDYRMAPENPHPIPTDDIYLATAYIFKHANELGVDVNRIALAGDSAGGNAVAVMTQRLKAENHHHQPKLQVLIYPWLQMWSHTLPSHVNYHYGIISISKLSLYYLGVRERAEELDDLLQTNNITALVEDKALRAKLISYLDVSQIDEKYRRGRSYYNLKPTYPNQLDAENILVRDKQLAKLLDKLRDPSISPLLAEESALAGLPPAYMIIVEWDTLKDEGLMYASRLSRAGTQVKVAFYENLFHGGITLPDNRVAAAVKIDLINYLKVNL